MEQNRCISLLGSTGSIGRQSLDVIAACGMRVAALTANRDVEQMEKQCRRFQPELAVMMVPEVAASVRMRLADTPIRVAEGMEGLMAQPDGGDDEQDDGRTATFPFLNRLFSGEAGQLLPEEAGYPLMLLSCVISLAAIAIAAFVGGALSYYLLYAMVAWLFALLVYYTVKMM